MYPPGPDTARSHLAPHFCPRGRREDGAQQPRPTPLLRGDGGGGGGERWAARGPSAASTGPVCMKIEVNEEDTNWQQVGVVVIA